MFPPREKKRKNSSPHYELWLQRGFTPGTHKCATLGLNLFYIVVCVHVQGTFTGKASSSHSRFSFWKITGSARYGKNRKMQNASPLICITTELEQSWRWINTGMTQCWRPTDTCYVFAVLWVNGTEITWSSDVLTSWQPTSVVSDWQFDNESSNRTARPHSWHCLNFSFTISDLKSVNVSRAPVARL